MPSNPERLMFDTHAAPSAGTSQTFRVEPWRGDLASVVVVVSNTQDSPHVNSIASTDVGRLAWVTDGDWYQSADRHEDSSRTISGSHTARTSTQSWTAVSTTARFHDPHETMAISEPSTVSKIDLVFIIIGSVIGFIVILVLMALCSIHLARKLSRRQEKKASEEAALEEVIRSGTITPRGQGVGLEGLKEASKCKREAKEFVLRMPEKPKKSDEHDL